MSLQGKGFFTTELSDCEDGEPASLLAAAQQAGLTHIFIKIADGVAFSNAPGSGIDLSELVVHAMHSAGMAVWGWHAIYGNDPIAEAATALKRLHALGLDGYVVDAGADFQRPGMAQVARQFMTTVQADLKIPIALRSYRFPNYHPDFPWSTFLEYCDIHMPKVYWSESHNAIEQLLESRRQCSLLPNARPFIPTGPTCHISGWSPSVEEMIDFLDTATTLQLPAISFFDWESCRKDLPSIWSTIATYEWPAAVQNFAGTSPAGADSIPDSLPEQTIPDYPLQANSVPVPDSLPLSGAIPVPDGLPSPQPAPVPDSLPSPEPIPVPDSLPSSEPISIPDSLPPSETIPDSDSLSLPDSMPAPDGLPSIDSIPFPDNLPSQDPISVPDSLPSPAPEPMETQPDAFLDAFLSALNEHQAEQLASFYAQDALQVWFDQTILGVPAIRENLAVFFTSLPASQSFLFSRFQIKDDQRLFAWRVGSFSGETILVLKEGKIVLDYTLTPSSE